MQPPNNQYDQAFDDALTHYEAGRWAEAEAIYTQLLQTDPDDADVLYLFATIAYQTARYQQAAELVTKAILIAPNDAEALNLAGVLELYYGKYNRAIDLLTRALAIAPEFSQAHVSLGRALEALGRYDEAVTSYRGALSLNPNDPYMHYYLGSVLQTQNKRPEAIAAYRRAIALKPDFFEVYCGLGATLQLENKFEEAIACHRHALTHQPESAPTHNDLGNAFKALGSTEQAIDCYRQAIRLAPDYGEAYFNLGATLHTNNELEEAVKNYRQAIVLIPNKSVIYNNLGLALAAQNKLDEAILAFQQVITLEPHHVSAINDIGNIYKRQKKFENAISCYRQAIKIDPRFAPAHSNLGSTLHIQGRLEEALTAHRQACAIKPDDAMYYNNLAIVFDALERFDEAILFYNDALALKPDGAEIHNNLGTVLKTLGKLDAAATSYRKAIIHKPDFTLAYSNLGNVLIEQGKIAEAIESYQRGLTSNPNDSNAHSNLLMIKHYDQNYTQAELLSDHAKFSAQFETPTLVFRSPHDNPREQQRKLKIGFVSGDLCEHPVGYFLESVLTHLDFNDFDITLYSTHYRTDAVTRRLLGMNIDWISLMGLADSQAAQQIRHNRIDILIDLSGHTGHNRLPMFAHKPAPVQVSWLGYWATTGLKAMDYILCDAHSIAADEANHFVEQLWYLPDTRLCFTPPSYTIDVSALPALSNGYITFGCFNNRAKINEDVIALWAAVLKRVANSRLLLKARQFSEADLREEMTISFARHGIAADRLLIEGPSSRADYLATYNRIDIVLDPFPFTGGTTSVEGLWMGVPFVTRQGHNMLSRQGESILHNVGLADWIAADNDAYINLLATRATDLPSLAQLRTQLRSRLLNSALCDAPRFASNLGSAFRGMWTKYCLSS